MFTISNAALCPVLRAADKRVRSSAFTLCFKFRNECKVISRRVLALETGELTILNRSNLCFLT